MTARTGATLIFGAILLAGCTATDMAAVTTPPPPEVARLAVEPPPTPDPAPDPALVAMYAARRDGERTLPAIDVTAFHRALLRNEVDYPTAEAPGTVVIDTHGPFLYLVEGDGKATRYGIAVGREGFGWTGSGTIARSAKWPRWTPPPEMIERDPHAGEVEGRPAGRGHQSARRAGALHQHGRRTIPATASTAPTRRRSIGWAASSGCFRMLNQDVVDLYDRVAHGGQGRGDVTAAAERREPGEAGDEQEQRRRQRHRRDLDPVEGDAGVGEVRVEFLLGADQADAGGVELELAGVGLDGGGLQHLQHVVVGGRADLQPVEDREGLALVERRRPRGRTPDSTGSPGVRSTGIA